MSRKLKSETQSFGPTLAAKMVLAVASVAIICIALIFQDESNRRDNAAISKQEAYLLELKKEVCVLESQAARLRSPEELRRKIRDMNIGLLEIEQSQIVRMYENGVTERKRPASGLVSVSGGGRE